MGKGEMKRVILADDDDETEEQETEDHEVHEQEETEVLEREETEDQDPEESESVNITPPPEYVIKKRTALTFPCSYCEKLFQTSLLRNVHEEENHGDVFKEKRKNHFHVTFAIFRPIT